MAMRGAPLADAPGRGTPWWVVFAHVAALVSVFLGERVFSTIATVRWGLSGLGFVSIHALTIVRWANTREPGISDERRAIERSLAILSSVGCLGLLVCATTVEPFDSKLGIGELSTVTRQRWQSAATVVWLVLVLGSTLPMLFAERALWPMRRAPRVEWRRVRASLVAGLSLGLAAVYGSLFTFVADSLGVRADFSYFHTARPSESTRKIARGADGPIVVRAFFPEPNEVGSEARAFVRDLATTATNVELREYDRLLMPEAAKEAKITEDGVIVVEHGEQRQSLVLGTDEKLARPKLKTLDADFQKALFKVLRARRTAYFTVGHGELNDALPTVENEGRSGRGARQILEQQNVAVSDLGATNGLGIDVPDDATLVVVLGPEKPFRPEEMAALERYADRGGRLFLAVDPDAKGEVSALAEVAGIAFSRANLANDKVHMRRRFNDSDRLLLATNRFSAHPSVSTLSRLASRPVLFLQAGALDAKRGEGGLSIDFAVRAMPETFLDDDHDFSFDAASEKRGSYPLVAAVTKRALPEELGTKRRSDEMRAFVIADADAASDAALGNDGNVLLVADGIRWLTGEESYAGELTAAEDVRIEHTKQKDLVWFYGTIFGAPAIVLAGGLVYTRRPRRKKRPGTVRATDASKAAPEPNDSSSTRAGGPPDEDAS